MKMIDTYEELITFIIILFIGSIFIIYGNKSMDELMSISFKLIGIFIIYNAVESKLFKEKIEHPNAYKVIIVFLITSTILLSVIIIRLDVIIKTIMKLTELF